jgi:peptide/nickel transport system permease protein
MLSGYYRGVTDTVISRLIDVTLAFPVLLLALGIASACSLGNGCLGGLIRPGKSTVIAAIVVINWTAAPADRDRPRDRHEPEADRR